MSQPKRSIRITTLAGLFSLLGLSLVLPGCNSDVQVAVEEMAKPASAETAEQSTQQYTCGMHPMIITDEPGLCPICNMDLTPLKSSGSQAANQPAGERVIKYWVAPMDPTFIRDEPGKSPMGMDLVPVYEDESASGSIITIDPVTIQNMGVRIAPVVRQDINRTIRTVGLVEYDEPTQYSVNAKVNGWIERLYINQTGQQVRKGQPLLDIYSPELLSAQEEFLLAVKNHAGVANNRFPEIAEGAKRLLEASRRRLQLWDISDRQVDALEKTGQVFKTMTLYAPYSGIVTLKMVNEGGYLKPGMELFRIADISKVWVIADIYEYELPWVKTGQSAKIILPYAGGREIAAEISYIYPYVEPKTRTIKARMEIANPDFELKPEMYVNVRIETEPVRAALTVPSEAILNTGEKQTIFIALGDGKFEPRQVLIGAQSDDGYTVIREGLLAGERVVVSAQFMLDSESKLREAIRKMLEPDKPSQNHSAHETDVSQDDLESLFDDETSEEETLDDLFKKD